MRVQHQWYPARVLHIEPVTPTVRQFDLAPLGGCLPWTPGAHLDVLVGDPQSSLHRSYSLIDAGAENAYRIAVKRVAPSRGGSQAMWNLREGDEIRVSAPANNFDLRPGAPEYLLIAGGIGITPLVSMVSELVACACSFRVMYAARNAEEFAYRKKLTDLIGSNLVLLDASRGEMLDAARCIAALHPEAEAYVCGPPGLMDAVRYAWEEARRPSQLLRVEKFGHSAAPQQSPFWVKVPRHGIEAQVAPQETLLDVLNRHGVPVLWQCEKGECGLCTMDVLEVQGSLDHRDVFLSREERRGGKKLCVCISRVNGGGVVLDSGYRGDALPFQ
jgi:vanillate O-demethylase ferredoxin subunit